MKILKSIIIGIVVTIGGLIFSDIFANTFNGLGYDTAILLGACMYLCVVLVTCTGIILSRIDTHRASKEQTDK